MILGVGLIQNAVIDTAARWPLFIAAASTLLGTMLASRGLAWLVLRQRPRRAGRVDAVLLLALLLAWLPGTHLFGMAFHALCFLVALGLALSMRHALVTPRSASERAIAVTSRSTPAPGCTASAPPHAIRNPTCAT